MAKFVHLHGHTQYSLLDGLSKIPQLVKTVKDAGMDALAITDHGVMYGAIEFYKACREAGVKPIIGVEMYVAKRSYKDKEGKLDSEPFHLTVLAKNYQGYLNLMKLTTIAHRDGYYYRPRVDKTLLKEFHEGLIVLSGCPSGEFIRSINDKDPKKAEEVLKTYLDIFGEGNFYLELQSHPYQQSLDLAVDETVRKDIKELLDIQIQTRSTVKDLSVRLGIPVVATNDYHYVGKEDAEAQDALLCIQTGKFLSEVNRMRMIDTPDYFVKTPEEVAEDFKDLPQALESSVRIAEAVDLEIPLGVARFPVFATPGKQTSMEYLRELTYQKAEGKLKITGKIKERLEYELSVIEQKNYADYFLVVSDFMEWAHQRGIITNTRGSAAASMVLYCLGVTNLNPLDYLLPFERFLTVYRPTLPDIDADIADDRRDEVIEYVTQKYGADRVAQIVTFGTMMGRAAIRDVGRVLGLAYGDVDRIAKLVPPPHQGFHKPLSDVIKEVPELAGPYRSDPQIKKLLDLAIKIEGTVRHASVHAAGLVIAPDEITNFTPLQRESSGERLVCQYDMFSLMDEYGGIGLVKMDLLGIRNLSILGKAVEFVKENRGVSVDLNKIPLDYKKAFDLLAKGETMGIFQLEGSGMTRYVMELKPTSVFDIQAMVALYRPGPLSVIPEYIARKHDPRKVKFFDPRMREYTENTFGLLVYQDDVLLTVINIAGYSWEEADKFRKAMGKKIPSEMAKQKGKFIEGCVSKGMRRAKADELFALIAPFAAYGFNKAHAASYAIIAYQTAYMKASYPVEFMSAVMTAESGDSDKIAAAIEECKRLGIVVLPPDVNKSGIGFSLEKLKELTQADLERSLSVGESEVKQGIRFGLSAIKNVGISAIESIISAREKGEFASLPDLCSRVDNRLVNRKTLESLIKAGTLDHLGSRAAQLLILDQCIEETHKQSKFKLSGQVSLFDSEEDKGDIAIKLPEVAELALEQLLVFEKELLGFYLHEPPYLASLKELSKFVSNKLSDLGDEHIGKSLKLGGVITAVKKVITKKTAKEMAFIKISDGISSVEVVVFPKTYETSKDFLVTDEVVFINGRVEKREEELSLIVEQISVFDPAKMSGEIPETGPAVEITIPPGTDVTVLQNINKTLRGFPGRVPVALLLHGSDGGIRRMDLPFAIDPGIDLEDKIVEILGEDSFKLV
ncbi:DNA polymerase III subunit alpha [Candidatus Daviesbacteria bacterium RIFCSPHIGHO2_02_FULL_41_10]|uniref:DNA polymerase III subunit alpha n=2 Tax=Candidatus Daviesiibacteriota TaxID=1752718 RepID=A0A1F5ITQ2_9BACT|nr:MAG: DNA polymerase III subunit alpha [Candidatus Daviesbacteria bacterium RIFCSPHIGHO2_01_FULL_41_23]OGE32503.1 MAG: DNA polymerase III subunit alpha [Candidatus Daviesbacteria bacterium RIFCSPHIGHO2_02_FULL_41_10]OGE62026.1 MAG: DNA polymerase III subunit alpha [Candidatus Daviesbacteria bacterium RIFCSPLOWO2_01_FULL_41_32]